MTTCTCSRLITQSDIPPVLLPLFIGKLPYVAHETVICPEHCPSCQYHKICDKWAPFYKNCTT